MTRMSLIDPGKKAPAFTLKDQDGDTHTPVRLRRHARGALLLPQGRHARAARRSRASSRRACRRSRRPRRRCSASASSTRRARRSSPTKHGLTFPLLADADHEVAEKYGVWQEKSRYGRKYMGIVAHHVSDRPGRQGGPALGQREGRRPRRRSGQGGGRAHVECAAVRTLIALARRAGWRPASPALAQTDFTGQWAPLYHEDTIERVPGPELGDYTGLPLTEAGADARRQLGRRPHLGGAGVSVPPALGRLLAARSGPDAHLGRLRPGHAAHRRVSDAHRRVREPAHDLPRRPRAPAGVRGAHVPGLLDGRVGRQHAHHHHHAPEGELPAPQRPAAQRQGAADRALEPARRST